MHMHVVLITVWQLGAEVAGDDPRVEQFDDGRAPGDAAGDLVLAQRRAAGHGVVQSASNVASLPP
jgi:hypothetical protein